MPLWTLRRLSKSTALEEWNDYKTSSASASLNWKSLSEPDNPFKRAAGGMLFDHCCQKLVNCFCGRHIDCPSAPRTNEQFVELANSCNRRMLHLPFVQDRCTR